MKENLEVTENDAIFAPKKNLMTMTQIILNIEDTSILPSLKTILKALKGVSLASPDDDSNISNAEDITATEGYQEAMEDKRCGRIYKAQNTEDMFKQILG